LNAWSWRCETAGQAFQPEDTDADSTRAPFKNESSLAGPSALHRGRVQLELLAATVAVRGLRRRVVDFDRDEQSHAHPLRADD
jgi:hypothetical protein